MKMLFITLFTFLSLSAFCNDKQQNYNRLKKLWHRYKELEKVITFTPLERDHYCYGFYKERSATGKGGNDLDDFYTSYNDFVERINKGDSWLFGLFYTPRQNWKFRVVTPPKTDYLLIHYGNILKRGNWSRGRRYKNYYLICHNYDTEHELKQFIKNQARK